MADWFHPLDRPGVHRKEEIEPQAERVQPGVLHKRSDALTDSETGSDLS